MPLVDDDQAAEIEWAASFYAPAVPFMPGSRVYNRADLQRAMGFGTPIHLIEPTPDMRRATEAAARWLVERNAQTTKIDRVHAKMLDTRGRIAADKYRAEAMAALMGSKPVPVVAPEGYDRAAQTVAAATETVWQHMIGLIQTKQAWGEVLFEYTNRQIRHHNAMSMGANKHIAPPTMDQAILGIGIAASDVDGYLRDVWTVFPVR